LKYLYSNTPSTGRNSHIALTRFLGLHFCRQYGSIFNHFNINAPTATKFCIITQNNGYYVRRSKSFKVIQVTGQTDRHMDALLPVAIDVRRVSRARMGSARRMAEAQMPPCALAPSCPHIKYEKYGVPLRRRRRAHVK